jgi:outer membrane lipoprotein-sorting protein
MFISPTKVFGIVCILIIAFFPLSITAKAKERAIENKVLSIAQEMASAFQRVQDYTCDVEVTYHQSWGGEEQKNDRYRFRFYFKREKKIRVEFSEPYPGAIVIYSKGNEKATVIPFNYWPRLRFNISHKHAILKTPTGQRLEQTDMGYFIDFVLQSLREVDQVDHQLKEGGEQITFLLRALDYVYWKRVGKYRIVISKKNWVPVQIERYELDGTPVESIHIRNYSTNTHLDDHLFHPWE